MYIRPNMTSFLVTDLTIGTSYHLYLEAIFQSYIPGQHIKSLKTWILIAMTKGFGPDNRTLLLLFSSMAGYIEVRFSCVPAAQFPWQQSNVANSTI